MYFVRSGLIYIPLSSLRTAGEYNYVWSATAYPTDIRYSFHLRFLSTNTEVSNNINRFYGFSLQNLISIALLYISSVVAISISPRAHFYMQVATAPTGPQPPTQIVLAIPSI